MNYAKITFEESDSVVAPRTILGISPKSEIKENNLIKEKEKRKLIFIIGKNESASPTPTPIVTQTPSPAAVRQKIVSRL